MESTGQTLITIKMLTDDIVYVERQGQLEERQLKEAFEKGAEIVRQLRAQGKPVLILNHAHDPNVSPSVLSHLLHFDFDKFAVYGTSRQVNNVRDLMVCANGMERKIASFETEKEALDWLVAKPSSRK